MEIELIWENPETKKNHQQKFALPLAIGREATRIPDQYQGQPLSKAVFFSTQVSGLQLKKIGIMLLLVVVLGVLPG